MTAKQKQQYIALHEKYGDIKIKCKGSDSLPIDAIMDFQGGLKKRSAADKIKLATSIFQKGFIAPFFVWDNKGDYCLQDGHGRTEVLCEIREAGIPIPCLFPVVYIEADNEQDAREKLLAICSQYGRFDKEELEAWLEGMDQSIKSTFSLLDGPLSTENNPEPEKIELQIGDTVDIDNSLMNLHIKITVDNIKISVQMLNRYLKWCSTNSQDPELVLNGEIYQG